MTNAFMKAIQPKGKGVKFTNIGDGVTMQINAPVTERQATTYVPGGQGEPRFFPSGDPIMEQVITGLDNEAESEAEAAVALYVDKPAMRRAIGVALDKVGAQSPMPGGTLKVTFIGYGVGKNPSAPPKNFEAEYWAPQAAAGSWGGEG